MLRDHPLTKLVISEGGFPEVVSLSALRRPLTDVIVQIHWRLGTGPIGSARIVQGVKVETIGSSRLPDQVLRWKYPWGHISELEELVEQTAWSLGGAYLERFAKAPYSGEQPYTAPGAGLRPSFCGLGKCYSFPGLGEASIGQMDNEDLMEEAARTGYWSWRFNVCFRMHQAHKIDRGRFEDCRRKDPTLQDDGSREGPFPGWSPREPVCGHSGEWWLQTAKEFQADDATSRFIPYDLTRLRLCYEAYTLAGVPDASGLKYGLYIHYGIATFARPGEQGQIPAERFAPTALDVKAWARTAKAAGMTFAVLTAKHESGFCLWDSADYSYDVAHTPFKGDIIGDFIAACDAEDILPGVHYSIPDRFNEELVRAEGPVSATYFALIKKHLTELHTRYPALRLQVLDGIGRLSADQFEEISQLIKQLTPGCVLLNSSKQEDRGPRYDYATIIKGLMWNPQAELSPIETLFHHYSWAQEAELIFLLNVGPDPSGRIPDDQIALLTQLKELIATPS